MIFKTRGIVFRFTKFRETSIIVTILTEAFGLQHYMVNGIRTASSRSRIALYQPLTLLDMVVYHRENTSIERIKEARCFYQYQTLATDVRKTTVAMFINELLNKSVKHESHAEILFAFIANSLIAIDQLETGFENSHLIFMVQLSKHLGFGPQFAGEVLGARVVEESTERAVEQLLKADYGDRLPFSNTDRRQLLEVLIKFYAEHIENLSDFKSVAVLREVLG